MRTVSLRGRPHRLRRASADGVSRKVESTLADGSRFHGDDKIDAVFATTTWDIGDDPHGMLQTLHRVLQASDASDI